MHTTDPYADQLQQPSGYEEQGAATAVAGASQPVCPA